jgi:hypothetical protein
LRVRGAESRTKRDEMAHKGKKKGGPLPASDNIVEQSIIANPSIG